jgi:hypothetical protein
MRFVLFPPSRHRHPLVHALAVLLGLALISMLLVFGVFVGAAILGVGAILLTLRMLLGRRTATSATQNSPTQVLEGEYVVIQRRTSTPR